MRTFAALAACLAALAAPAAGCGGGGKDVATAGGGEDAAAVAGEDAATGRVVGCGDVILKARSGTADGYRVILGGAVSVPPAYLPQTFATRNPDWPFWEKAGIAVRAGRGPVEVSVPERWRDRAAIGWGNPARPSSDLLIASCPGRGWNAYAGGFFLKRRSGCVPVTFRVGDRRATLTFGLRTRCQP